ncbi:adenylate/guanylate cyclase family protein [Paenibacillus sp. BK033]|uniref:adenylate/guanylate cyclase domain-containing protein n=1 Tax=Paenibacillus sp. BK033 TaxID=2512133 RepID=UPI0010494649|nr:adenylate/guanylate cyclase domain-containing protein [Paenibacillus sp. BK033]TCM92712.1 adenylate/guanylate cyclase family protein [Paenibacillus sp. BK033]
MHSNYKEYEHIKSYDRLQEILDASDNSYSEVNDIPSREKLTFTNGYYTYCSALYVDIRDSSELPKKYNRPKLAKLYRSYISEMVAIINGNVNCKEINIEGDCVFGVFSTPSKRDIDNLFSTAAKINSLVKVLNYKLKKKNYDHIKVGIGLHYGRALMIKAGYSGSGINDVVWMGDVLNDAAKLCGFGSKSTQDYPIMMSDVFYSNLNDVNKKLLSYNYNRSCYHGNVINTLMEDWYQVNCK